MTEKELTAYRIAGELYGRLRSHLDGGKLTRAYEKDVGAVDYRWSVRRKRKEYAVRQCVALLSLAEADEIDSLLEGMLFELREAVTDIDG